MTGFRAFLGKELREIVKTWRIWVLPGIGLFFAVTGPVIARFTPQLLAAVAPDTGLVFQIPNPTFLDAYLQWTKNLIQLVTFAIIIIFAGVVSAERRSGTAVLVLTKPLSRRAFIAAKAVAQGAFLMATVAVGAAVTWALTYAVFGEAPLVPFVQATGIWLVWALMVLGIMVFLSSLVGSQAGAAGLGLGVFVLFSIGSIWTPVVRYSPAGLLGAPTDVLLGRAGPLLWPVVTGLVLTGISVAAAVVAFSRKEL
ncbi:ABC transporter permease [Candidatus Bipolaricaulota bacterium]|nr:ABC transporter permease [Candidatus Bipolaricaulota bacterium]